MADDVAISGNRFPYHTSQRLPRQPFGLPRNDNVRRFVKIVNFAR